MRLVLALFLMIFNYVFVRLLHRISFTFHTSGVGLLKTVGHGRLLLCRGLVVGLLLLGVTHFLGASSGKTAGNGTDGCTLSRIAGDGANGYPCGSTSGGTLNGRSIG